MMRIGVATTAFETINNLRVAVGTSCPQEREDGQGERDGRTLFRLTDGGRTDISIGINGCDPQPIEAVEIVLGGDSECDTFTKALEWAANTLRAMQAVNAAYQKWQEEAEDV